MSDAPQSSDDFVCLYVDNSNIFHEGQRFAEQQRSEDRYAFRIDFTHFSQLLLRNRPVREVVWGGSIPPATDTVWQALKDRGVDPHLIPRSDTGENETVDHKIQLLMHRHVRKYRDNPGTIVVCTGDGKGYHNEEGFLYDLEGHVEAGWAVEVISWTHSCHRHLRQFAEDNGRFIALDNFYDAVTYIKGGRHASGAVAC